MTRIKRSTETQIFLCVSVVILCFGGVVVAAEELPLPPDVRKKPVPYDLVMGTQPMQVIGMRTKLSMDQARAFYDRTLRKQGWTISEVPWLAESIKGREQLRKSVEEDPKLKDDPKAAAVLNENSAEQLRMAAQQQLYANRGMEHVLIGFSPSGEQTLLAISQWKGESSSPAGPASANPPVGGQGEWPSTNPCCEDAGVPEALRQAPSSIPAYPNGRMISTGAAPRGLERTNVSEAYLTVDPASTVVEFYRKHMTYNGWTEVQRSKRPQADINKLLGPQAGRFHWDALTFRSEQGLCTIVVTEHQAGEAGATPSPLALLLQQSTEKSGALSDARTVIAVNYMQSSGLGRQLVPPNLKGNAQ